VYLRWVNGYADIGRRDTYTGRERLGVYLSADADESIVTRRRGKNKVIPTFTGQVRRQRKERSRRLWTGAAVTEYRVETDDGDGWRDGMIRWRGHFCVVF
jgi:hypothetical protein